MESKVIVVPSTPDPAPNPDPPTNPDHGVEIGRLMAEHEELRRKLEEMQEHVAAVESTANFAADVATIPNPDPEPDEDSLREPALEELLAAMYAGDEDEEEAVVVDEPPPPPPAPPEKKKWWVI